MMEPLKRHWLVDHPASGQQTFAVKSPVHATNYQQREGFEVTGPYVPIEQLDALRALIREYLRVDGSQGRYDALDLHAARAALFDHIGRQ